MKWLHKKFGWGEHRFHPFDCHDHKVNPIQCRWCGKWFQIHGYRFINATFTEVTANPR